jgi:hypothetical protein
MSVLGWWPMAMKQPFSASSRCAVLRALQAHAGDAGVVAQHLVERVPQVQLDLAGGDLGHHLVDHDGLGAELVAAVHQVHLAAMLDRYSASSTAVLPPPTTQTVSAAVEEAVAGGAAAHARPMKACSLGRPRYLALAPVAMISVSQV